MIGQALSHFEITAKLGEGGMGAVYRARDTKLGREVAIKVLPEAFTEHPERLARFEREAKVLASLNHPGIAAIYEVGSAVPTLSSRASEASHEIPRPENPATAAEPTTPAPCHFLAMELVEGEDLSERLGRGAIPVTEALVLAVQIADALEAAHENGIVHRDLKPANVRLTPESQVKVLDFGLAKASEGTGGSVDMTRSPTLTAQMTQAGTLLGTAAYMSPEQARGEEADRRADVWAFGLLLSEMLSGRKTFNENTVSDTLAAVLKSDPDLSGLPAKLPAAAHRLIERCLRKDARERLRDMGDVGLELREIQARLNDPVQTAEDEIGGAKPALPWRTAVVALVLGVAAALAAWTLLPSKSGPAAMQTGVVRFGIPAPDATVFIRGLAVSPDGSRVAMTVRNEQGRTEIWVRALDSLEVQRIPGTASGARYPFWSPDGRQLGFFANNALRIVDLIGTPPRVLVSGLSQAPETRGGTWGADGTIVYAPTYIGGLMRIPAAGGDPEVATVLDPEVGNGTHRFPSFLPDGRHFLFYAATGSGAEPGQVRLGELGSTATRLLTTSSSAAILAPPNRLLFTRGDILVTQRLDLETFEMIGNPRPMDIELPGGLAISGLRSLSASHQGTLAYLVDDLSWTRMVWVDRDGTVLGELEDPDTWHYAPRVSPDGGTVAVGRSSADTNGSDIWLFDRARGLGTPFVSGPDDEDLVAWSPDGQRLAFTITASNNLQHYVTDLDGHRTLLSEGAEPIFTSSWTRDGTGVIVDHEVSGSYDIAVLSFESPGGPPKPLLATQYSEWDGEISPDGRWMAYASDSTGRNEVFVRPVNDSQSSWQVSTNGGSAPVWSHDGREIYYISIDDWMHAAEVTTTDRFSTAAPERLFKALVESEPSDRQYDVAPDGVFLVNRRSNDATQPITVILGLDRLLEP